MRVSMVMVITAICCAWGWTSTSEAATLQGQLVQRVAEPLPIHSPSTEAPTFMVKDEQGNLQDISPQQSSALVGQTVQVRDRDPNQPGVQGTAVAADSTRLAALTPLGNHNVAVIMVNFTDNRTTPFDSAQVRNKIFDGANSVNQFYDE